MAARSFQIALTAGVTRLSDVYNGLTPATLAKLGISGGFSGGPNENIGGTPGSPDARTDVPYRQILLIASGATAYIGGADMGPAATTPVSSTNYGMSVLTTGLVAQVIGAYDQGPLKLSDLYASGAGATLHILATPY
jgi:hypothetical protein